MQLTHKRKVRCKEDWMRSWLNLRFFQQREWCNWHRHVHLEEAFPLTLWESSSLDSGVDTGRLSTLPLVASSTTGFCQWHLQAWKYSYLLSNLHLLPYSLHVSGFWSLPVGGSDYRHCVWDQGQVIIQLMILPRDVLDPMIVKGI